MNYFALLMGPEPTLTDDAFAAELARYTEFETRSASALATGDALAPSSDGARITGGPHNAICTDGPYAEASEVAGGYYVIDVPDLDDAIDVARQIPAAESGAVELWPMAMYNPVMSGANWIALLREPATNTRTPGSPEWNASVEQHGEFAAKVGEHLRGGGALQPVSAATTVRVRDGETLITDGPYLEGAEVANGFYVFAAEDRAAAVEIAGLIPSSGVELRGLAGIPLAE